MQCNGARTTCPRVGGTRFGQGPRPQVCCPRFPGQFAPLGSRRASTQRVAVMAGRGRNAERHPGTQTRSRRRRTYRGKRPAPARSRCRRTGGGRNSTRHLQLPSPSAACRRARDPRRCHTTWVLAPHLQWGRAIGRPLRSCGSAPAAALRENPHIQPHFNRSRDPSLTGLTSGRTCAGLHKDSVAICTSHTQGASPSCLKPAAVNGC